MSQLSLFDKAPAVVLAAVEQLLFFTCPRCAYRWHGATLVVGAWWYAKPEQVAKEPYCPQCDQRPPMQVEAVTREENNP